MFYRYSKVKNEDLNGNMAMYYIFATTCKTNTYKHSLKFRCVLTCLFCVLSRVLTQDSTYIISLRTQALHAEINPQKVGFSKNMHVADNNMS